ncbi:MAG: hypothetical protein HOV83_19140 [Catenulispora sp.]|nr:hypothetical protein [Catenulispora sp.]
MTQRAGDGTDDASDATGRARPAADAEHRDVRRRLASAAVWAHAHLPAYDPARRAA